MSHRHSRLRRSAACAAVLAIVGTSLIANPQAQAAQLEAQQTYTCAITVDENPTEPAYLDLNVNVALNVPDQVAPGDSFSADGSFSVQLPTEMAALFSAYFPSAHVTSDALNFPVNVGGQQMVVGTSMIDSGQIDTRKPPVVFGGDFSTNPIEVPPDAQGEIAITMPQNGSVPATSRDGMAAFTAVMVAEGGIVPGYDRGTDRISCDVASGEPSVIGTVPIGGGAGGNGGGDNGGGAALGGAVGDAPQGGHTGGGAPASGGGGNRIQAAQGGNGNTGGGAGAHPGAQGGNAGQPGGEHGGEHGEGAAPDADGGAGNSSNDAANQQLADMMRLQSMNEAAAQNQDKGVSGAMVGWTTAGLVLASILFTVATNARTRRIERDADLR